MTSDSYSKANDEYSFLAENLRHYENLFFASLTAFLTVNAGLIGLVFAMKSPPPPSMFYWMRWVGIFLVVVFGTACETYLRRCYRLALRAIELEETELCYKQYRLISPPNIPKVGGWLWRALFALVAILWYVTPLTLSTQGGETSKTTLNLSESVKATNTK